jgi:two-component system cell cycle sensor histidine kinase/response regulator CckA
VPQTLAEVCPAMTRVIRRVLLVDDEDTVRNVLRRYLELRGWSVLEATTAEEALVLLETEAESVGVVVVDFHLPGLSGGALCRRIATEYPMLASRMLMASGDALEAVSALAREAFHCPVLTKPFDLLDFVHALDEMATTA